MAIFQSNTNISKSINEVYLYLEDLNNHEQLMPENIYDWSSTKDEARFTIKNMAKLALIISERIDNERVVCVPSESAPFKIELSWDLEKISESETKATFVIDADLNMMMKMVASGPLQKLVDHQVNKLKEILG